MRLTSWFIYLGDLIFTEAKGRGECKISRDDKWWWQPISKVNNCFIKCILSYVCMLGIILWRHNNLKIYSPITAFIHLWRHSLTSATLFLAYIKFYHAISHVDLANQKREILEALSLINLLVDLCRMHTKTTCSFSCNQETSFQCEAKQIIYMIGFPPTT